MPITSKNSSDNNQLLQKVEEINNTLRKQGIRVHIDDRDNYKPGWKFNHWELKGIPIRIEIG